MKRHLNRDGQPFFRKSKGRGPSPKVRYPVKQDGNRAGKIEPERLVACCLKRDGGMISRALKSHAEIRRFLGDANPYVERPGDECGFFTSTGRYVNRREAAPVGVRSGQLPEGWGDREVLSSDIEWEGRR